MSAVMPPLHSMIPDADRRPARLEPDRRRSPAATVAVVVALLAALALAVWGVRHLIGDAKPPARQVSRIAILPDTPPPPPPPKVEQKVEPKPEARPQPQQEAPKVVAPPAPAPLKMEGPAGDGPSAFSAGPVTHDYAGGPVVSGGTGGGGVDRAQERLYANTVRQLLRDELERQLGADAGEVSAQLAVWVAADGRITRWEWSDAGAARAGELDSAMQRTAGALRLPAPVGGAATAMRFRLTLRSAG